MATKITKEQREELKLKHFNPSEMTFFIEINGFKIFIDTEGWKKGSCFVDLKGSTPILEK